MNHHFIVCLWRGFETIPSLVTWLMYSLENNNKNKLYKFLSKGILEKIRRELKVFVLT